MKLTNRSKLLLSSVVGGIILLGGVTLSTIGQNDAGYRTVLQYPNGSMSVQYDPGYYLKWFAKTTIYPDVTTMDFDNSVNPDSVSIDQKGIAVRYRDGGTGTIFGKARYALSLDEDKMIKMHKETRGPRGVSYKLIKPTTEEAINQTAGLMDSEEGYGSKRSVFTQMSKSQIGKGLYETKATTTYETDEATGKTVAKTVATIRTKDGKDMHFPPALAQYGITLTSLQLNNPTFEKKTLKQIADKREATMAIITSKANAEKAKQDAITAEESGKADVMTAKYKREVVKAEAKVEAEMKAEVAVIKATQEVEVAKQGRLEAEQLKLQAVEYKAQQILIGEGEAERKKLVMEADGALEQKLATYKAVNYEYAKALGNQKQVPEIQFGVSGDSEGGNNATALIDMLSAKAAKDLGLTLQVQ